MGHTHIIERLARPGKAGANYSLTIVVLCVSALTPLKLADPASALTLSVLIEDIEKGRKKSSWRDLTLDLDTGLIAR